MKYLLLLSFNYFLALIQISFLPHFISVRFFPGLILMAVVAISFLEKPSAGKGIIAAFTGGFFLDVFSEGIMGLWISILMVVAVLIKYLVKRHVQVALRF